MPDGGRTFQIDFDFIDHVLVHRHQRRAARDAAAASGPVAAFYAAFMARLAALGIEVHDLAGAGGDGRGRSPSPNASPSRDTIPPRQADAVARLRHRRHGAQAFPRRLPRQVEPGALLLGELRPGADALLRAWRRRRIRAASAPRRPGDARGLFARGMELPGSGREPRAASSGRRSTPTPIRSRRASRRGVSAAAGARTIRGMREFVLPYDEVRRHPDPRRLVQDFLQSAVRGGGDAPAARDRASLERAVPRLRRRDGTRSQRVQVDGRGCRPAAALCRHRGLARLKPRCPVKRMRRRTAGRQPRRGTERRMEVFSPAAHQRADARLDLRSDRHRLHDGLRHHRHGELRPWRRVHGVGLHRADRLSDPHDLARHLRRSRWRSFIVLVVAMLFTSLWNWVDRAPRLSAVARLVPAGAADLGDRHVDLPVEFRAGRAGPAQQADPADGRRQRHPSVRSATITPSRSSYKQIIIWCVTAVLLAGFWYLVPEDAARPGAARLRAGPQDGGAGRRRCRPHHLDDLRDRRRARRRRRHDVPDVSTAW